MAGVRTLASGLLQGIQEAADNSPNEIELIVVTTTAGQSAFAEAGVDLNVLSRNHRVLLLPEWCAKPGAALLTTISLLPLVSTWYRASVILSYDYMSPLFSNAKQFTVVTDLRLQGLKKIKIRPFSVFVRSLFNWANSKLADSVIAISEHSAEEFRAVYGDQEQRVTAIPLGVHAKKTRTVPPSQGHILSVGTTHSHKRFDTLIEAAVILRSWGKSFEIHHYGFDGGVDHTLRQLVRSNNLDNQFIFHGHVSNEHLEQAHRRAAVFVATSEFEGFGLTPAEAASHGVPVVATNIAAHVAAVPSAAFFAVGDSTALATLLAEHLDRPRWSGDTTVRTWTTVGEDYIDLMDSAVAGPT